MADFVSSGWPAAATVSAYARDAFGNATGAAVASGTASSAGVVTFTGLADAGRFVASDGSRSVRFGTPAAQPGAASMADGSVRLRHASDLLRSGGWMPTGAIDHTIADRIVAGALTPVSGTLYLAGGVVIPAGRTVSTVSFLSSTGATTPANQWFCIVDQARSVLATTIDDLTAAWGANTVKTLALATALGGSTPGGAYTPANDIEVYLGVCQVAATPAILRSTSTQTGAASIAPINVGASTTGLTTPASLGATAGAMTASTAIPYGWVS